MKTCREIMEWFDEKWPESLAFEWDNVGLLAGRSDKEVHKVYIALDATDEVVAEAVQWGADMLITHHPLIFGSRKKINDADAVGRRLLTLIRADISYYAGHTSFDIAKGGMADLAAELFGFYKDGAEPLEVTGEQDGVPVGIGTVGVLKEPMNIESLALLIKRRFEIPAVTLYCKDADALVQRVAISPGSGKSMRKSAVCAGAEVLITGDMGHHEGLDLVDDGIALIDAGHYGLEHIFINKVTEELEKAGFELEIAGAPVSYPCQVL